MVRRFHVPIFSSTCILIIFIALFHQAQSQNASLTIDYSKVGACNSSIVARIGDSCDYLLKIIVSRATSSNVSTDIDVEILMPENDTLVMEMSKPTVTFVGGNFNNPSKLYDPVITLSSTQNSSQYDNAKIDFGTVTNAGLLSPNNSVENSIIISFRSIVVNSPTFQRNGSQYWVTVGVEYNNVSEIWIGQALFLFSNSSNTRVGSLRIGSVNNSTLQIPQGSPFKLLVPVVYNATFASNIVFTVTNNDPTKIGLCGAYVDSATAGFQHIPSLGYEISNRFTTRISTNQIQISLSQIVNTESYSGSDSTLYFAVYGRLFKTDGITSMSVGSFSTQISSSTSGTVSQSFTIYSLPTVISSSINGSLPTFAITPGSRSVSINQAVVVRVTVTVPLGFSAPVVIDLNGALNMTIPTFKSCSVIFQSAGENVAGSHPSCMDTNTARRIYSSSNNSTFNDQLTYDYGVLANLGTRSTTYADEVNDIVFDAIFQLFNTTETTVRPTVLMSMGNNTIWLGDLALNVSTVTANITNSTRPIFQLSYADNSTVNQSMTDMGSTRLFYYDIFTKPNSIYSPMVVRITTNETSIGSNKPAISICAVKVLYIGQNIPCLLESSFTEQGTTLISYESRYTLKKYDTAYVNLGPICNYATTQTNDELGRIRIGVYVKVESDLGAYQSNYVNLDVFYTPSNLWIGQILFTGRPINSPSSVSGIPLLFPLNSSSLSFNRNQLTVIQYGLKIPPMSRGTYSSLTSTIMNEPNAVTSVCRVNISPKRGANVPCSNDISSISSFNSNGYVSGLTTDLGLICNVATNSSTINGSLSLDEDTLILQVFLLASDQSSSTFGLSLSNLTPYGQAALSPMNVTLNSGSVIGLGNPSFITSINASVYQHSTDSNNQSLAFYGQDIRIQAQINFQANMTTESCYNVLFQFGIGASSIDAAYFTNAFVSSHGDNIACVRSKAQPVLDSGGSLIYNTSMFMDLGTLCYYPFDLWNASANFLTVQTHVRLPITTSVPLGSQFSVSIGALLNQNQSVLNTSLLFTVTNVSSFTSVTGISSPLSVLTIFNNTNATVQGRIREVVTYSFKIYIPQYAQRSIKITIGDGSLNTTTPIHIVSARIVSAGINVGSFMREYELGDRYVWNYYSTVSGSLYKGSGLLDLGVISNTGVSSLSGNISNSTDDYIFLEIDGFLTDSPGAEQNAAFSIVAIVISGGSVHFATFNHQVVRNGSEKPVMFINRTDLTNGSYASGATFSTVIHYGHLNESNAECINAQIMLYLPSWIQLMSFNASPSVSNYSTDNKSYVLFEVGNLQFFDVKTLQLTLLIGTSNDMSLAYARYYSPKITIPYELMCRKRTRNNTSVFPASKIFVFSDIISLDVDISSVSPSNNSLLDLLQPCQFTTSVPDSIASDVRSTGWRAGYRSNRWMLSGGTYVQISFGNLTSVQGILLTVPVGFAPLRTIKLGYSWDGIGFVVDPKTYDVNGSSSYNVPLSKPLLLRYLRIYLIDVVNPFNLSSSEAGFQLNITGEVNGTGYTVADVCSNVSNSLSARTILLAPGPQAGLSFANDIYVCDETVARTSMQCYLLYNGDTSPTAIWSKLNATVANINLFVFDTIQQTQSLYGYAQDGRSILRSDDRGQTWSVTTALEYSNITSECQSIVKVCSVSDAYPVTMGTPGWFQLQNGMVQWTASIQGLWTQQVMGSLVFDWFN